MKLKIFGVFDTKAGAFLSPPMFFGATGQAVRYFSDGVNEPGTAVNRHPGDYRLFQLGEYDDQDGSLIPLEKPVPLGFGTEFVSKDVVSQKFPVVHAVDPKKAS